ncbi:hypothetical protein ACWEF9_03475 [Streptomyces sp. NPDC004980]
MGPREGRPGIGWQVRGDEHRARPNSLFPRQQVRTDKRDVLTAQRVTVDCARRSPTQGDGRSVNGYEDRASGQRLGGR